MTAGVLALSLLALGGNADASQYTDEQIERCGPNIEHVKKLEAKHFVSAEEKAAAVDDAQRYLHMCLDLSAAQPYDVAERAARVKCPCKIADVEWGDEEGKQCRRDIEEYYRSALVRGLKVGPGTEVAGLIEGIRSCLVRTKANRVRLAREAQAEADRDRMADDARAQEAEESRARAERDEQHRQSPAFMRKVWSAQLCTGEQRRSSALALLAREKKYSAVTGSANLTTREELKRSLQAADELIAQSRSELKRTKGSPLSCSGAGMREATACIDAPADGECARPEIQDILRLADVPDEE